MATVVIPVRSDLDDYTITVILNEVTFGLHFARNSRDERWIMEVRDADGVTLHSGRPVVVDYPLVSLFPSRSLPNGFLIAIDTSGAGREIQEKEDFGDRVKLVFKEAA